MLIKIVFRSESFSRAQAALLLEPTRLPIRCQDFWFA